MERQQVEMLYRRFGPMVYRRAMNILRTETEAQEAMQDVFVTALSKGVSFRGESSPTTWLYSVTTNLCLNRLRNRKRRHQLMSEYTQITKTPNRPHPELLHLVCGLLRTAPVAEAQAAVYYYFDEMTQEEIADITKTARRTVGDLLKRFRRRVASKEVEA
jgi:RNA polymerase sigma-70 factor (ECF subfamily)